MNLINATLLLAHFLITSNISCVLCVPMCIVYVFYDFIFSWCFKFTLCKHVRLSYVFFNKLYFKLYFRLTSLKTKELLVLRRPSARHFTVCNRYRLLNSSHLLNFWEFIFLKPFLLLHMSSIFCQLLIRLYLLAVLKSYGLSRDALHVIFIIAIVLSVVTYTLPSFARQLSKGDKAHLDRLFRKAFRRGFCCQTFSIVELILAADKTLFHRMRRICHSTLSTSSPISNHVLFCSVL